MKKPIRTLKQLNDRLKEVDDREHDSEVAHAYEDDVLWDFVRGLAGRGNKLATRLELWDLVNKDRRRWYA